MQHEMGEVTRNACLMLQPVVREYLVRQTHHVGEEAHGREVDRHDDGCIDRCHNGIGQQRAVQLLAVLIPVVAEEADTERVLRDEAKGRQAGDHEGDEHSADHPQNAEASGDCHGSADADFMPLRAGHHDVMAIAGSKDTHVMHDDHDRDTPRHHQDSQTHRVEGVADALTFF